MLDISLFQTVSVVEHESDVVSQAKKSLRESTLCRQVIPVMDLYADGIVDKPCSAHIFVEQPLIKFARSSGIHGFNSIFRVDLRTVLKIRDLAG